MRPVPLWRFAPFRAPAAFDMNLCTDSVLPRSIAPGPVTPRLGFVATSLLHSLEIQSLKCRMGPFPARTPRNSLILTGLITCSPATPSHRGFHLVCAAGIPRRKPRLSLSKTHSLHLIPADFTGFLQRFLSRQPRFCSRPYPDAADCYRGSGASARFPRHPNSQTGAYGHSSQCPVPGT